MRRLEVPPSVAAEADIALEVALFADFLAHGFQFADAADVALAAACYATMHPLIFADDLTVELVAFDLFLVEDLVAPGFKVSKALGQFARAAAVDPQRLFREGFQEAAVVADEDDRGAGGYDRSFRHSIAGRSRWFVGSSRSSTSGLATRALASAARRASPPERWAGSSSPIMPKSSRSLRARYG